MTIPTCDGNHEQLDQAGRRRHYHRGCKDDLTRAAVTELTAANKVAKAARALAKPTTADADTTEYVDHFKTAQTPTPAAPKPSAPKAPEVYTVPSVGASRRLRSLTNLGHTPKDLAECATLSADSVWWLLIAPPARIQEHTDQVITAAFLRLRLEPKSLDGATNEGRAATRARALAELHDWPGPFDWDNIDVSTEQPKQRPTKRDPIALAEAIAQAKLDAPSAPPADEIANQLRHTQILLDEMTAARDFAVTEVADANRSIAALTEPVIINTTVFTTDDSETQNLRDQLKAEVTDRARAQETLESVRQAHDRHQNLHRQAVSDLAWTQDLLDKTLDQRDTALAAGARLADTAAAAEPISHGVPLLEFAGVDANLEECGELIETQSMSITIDPTPAGGLRLTLPALLLSR